MLSVLENLSGIQEVLDAPNPAAHPIVPAEPKRAQTARASTADVVPARTAKVRTSRRSSLRPAPSVPERTRQAGPLRFIGELRESISRMAQEAAARASREAHEREVAREKAEMAEQRRREAARAEAARAEAATRERELQRPQGFFD